MNIRRRTLLGSLLAVPVVGALAACGDDTATGGSTGEVTKINYGYIPHTVAGDGDPVDVLVVAPYPLQPGVVIRARPVGVLKMEDEGGVDAKVVAVPVSKLTPLYDNVKTLDDLPELLLKQTQHFFEHYKDLEPGKWVKVTGWGSVEDAKQEILDGIAAANK